MVSERTQNWTLKLTNKIPFPSESRTVGLMPPVPNICCNSRVEVVSMDVSASFDISE
jgi:hypothetical protein